MTQEKELTQQEKKDLLMANLARSDYSKEENRGRKDVSYREGGVMYAMSAIHALFDIEKCNWPDTRRAFVLNEALKS